MNAPTAPPQPPAADAAAVVELRQYTLRPGGRDVLVALFERELVEPQEQAGMRVIGQFADLDDPDRFVWLRGFPDMRARRASLAAFYDGPVWAAHRDAANATMVDSDDVLLLRPARPGAGFDLSGERPPAGAGPEGRGAVAATVVRLDGAGVEAPAVAAFEAIVAPAVAAAGATVLGYLLTEPSPNDFPRLPVREGERVLAWLAGFTAVAALDAAAGPIGDAVEAAFGRGRSARLRLAPTPRSLLAGSSPSCPALAAKGGRRAAATG